MYSLLVSRIDKGIEVSRDFLRNIIKDDFKVAIFPWAFPVELNSDSLMNEYFKKGDKKYNKYITSLLKLNIKESNITIGNCYSDSKEKLREIIKNSDILVLPGGNPEMFFSKVVHDKEILYDLKYYDGIIIGESAGCVLQQKRYFITAKNNYYNYFAFYDGFGIIDDPFYIDVHSINNHFYLKKLQKVAIEKHKDVYAIYDDGAIVLNRKDNSVRTFGNVRKFSAGK